MGEPPPQPPGAGPVAAAVAVRVVPARRLGSWAFGVVVAGLVAWVAVAGAGSGLVDGAVVRRWFTNRLILEGLWATLGLAVASQALGIVLGVVLAVMRLARNPATRAVGGAYVWFFRGTPVLVQLFFWFNGVPTLWKHIRIAVPFTHLALYSARTVAFMTPFRAALLGLGLNEAAYMAEIIRAGIEAVDPGQTEAAQALGMTRRLTLRRVVLPQAMRVVIPPTGNEFVSMLKTTSLAATITYLELFRRAEDIYTANLEVVPLLVVISIWYLILTTVAGFGQGLLERRYSRGRAGAAGGMAHR